MRIAINAASAQTGGAVTYLRNVVPALDRFMAANGGGRIALWASPEAVRDVSPEAFDYRDPAGATRAAGPGGMLRRLWFDQWELPRRVRQDKIDALFSSANFGTLRSPVPQVLLVRNSLYFDPVTMSRTPSRAVRARYFAQRILAVRSIVAADVVLFPTRAMRDLVAPHVRTTQERWRIAPYGARHDLFHPTELQRPAGSPAFLLNVSLYCDQKNLGTLFQAMRLLHGRSPGRHRLRITAGMRSVRPPPVHPNLAEELSAFLALERDGAVADVDKQQYGSLPELYRAADVFVFPSYTESFGHPLIEAMACGLPVVAADVPVNREMCGDAALYFSPFDAEGCAAAVERVVDDASLAARLRGAGILRARDFTWERHVSALWSAFRGALS